MTHEHRAHAPAHRIHGTGTTATPQYLLPITTAGELRVDAQLHTALEVVEGDTLAPPRLANAS
jgi:hypothetical protein